MQLETDVKDGIDYAKFSPKFSLAIFQNQKKAAFSNAAIYYIKGKFIWQSGTIWGLSTLTIREKHSKMNCNWCNFSTKRQCTDYWEKSIFFFLNFWCKQLNHCPIPLTEVSSPDVEIYRIFSCIFQRVRKLWDVYSDFILKALLCSF